MIIKGTILDDVTGSPISGWYAVVNDGDFSVVQPFKQFGADGSFTVDLNAQQGLAVSATTPDITESYVFLHSLFSGTTGGTIQEADFTVNYQTGSNKSLYAVAGLGALLLLTQKDIRRRKTVSGVEPKTVQTGLLIVGGLIGLTVVNKVLEKLGILKSEAEKEIDTLQSNSQNFWNPNFWQQVNPSGVNWTNPITEDQAATYAKQIHDSFGITTPKGGGVPEGIIRSVSSQATVSFIAWEFQKIYGSDLLEFLRHPGGIFPWDGLSDDSILQLTNFIKTLPQF